MRATHHYSTLNVALFLFEMTCEKESRESLAT